MENDSAVDMQAESDPEETTLDDELLAEQPKGLGIQDGTSNT